MVTLDELATKGKRNLGRKIETMKASYPKSASRAKDGFAATPFGPTRKAAYNKAWETMPANYDTKVKPGIEDKWATNWSKKMAE